MSALRESYDVVVVGAGPAGLAAAATCAKAGLSTVLFDEQASAGGQIYRSITETPVKDESVLGPGYWKGAPLVEAFAASGAQYVPGATVWSLTRDREIGVSFAGGSQLLNARRVILCTGALERPFPIPGWTLPGVMTAGAAQILLKSSGLLPAGRSVLAGSGPLLWLVAWQYLNAGARFDLILDTTDSANRGRAAAHFPQFLCSEDFRDGLKLVRAVRRKIGVISGVTSLRAIGSAKVSEVAFSVQGRAEDVIPVDTLLLHQGVVPNVNLQMSVGIEHRWDDAQLCWTPVLDGEGSSSVEGIAVAGDGAGIAGADAARWRGVIAAVAAARALGRPIAGNEAQAARQALKRALRGRAFLDTLYRPAKQFRQPSGDTIVCRCEEVTAKQVIDTVALGCPGPNQMKAFLRCGMGPCQGRLCGLTVTELIAEGRGVSPQQVGYYRLRPPVKPITVEEIAALPKPQEALDAVVR